MHLRRLLTPSISDEPPSAVERILTVTDATGRIAPFDLADALGGYLASARFVTPREATDWLAGILNWLPLNSRSAQGLAGIVLEALIAVGTYGVGTSFGQKVLVQLPGRLVMIPGIGRVKVGGLWQAAAEPAFLGSILSKADGDEEAISLFEAIGLAELTPEIVRDLQQLIGQARHGIPIEGCAKIWHKRLVVLICGFDTADLTWKMSTAQASALMEWAGLTPAGSVEEASDPDQALVVGLPITTRVIVSAGPGSGKTQVVCRRIVHLLEQGTSASRIWLLSFTRVAIEELRKRIGGAVSSSIEARSLHVATFDSFASRILDAALPVGAARPIGYDAAVEAASAVLSEPSPRLRDYFAGLSHVVIDEAQDLLGARLSMMRRFIELLPATCGLTILGDKAQSIYGWSISQPNHQLGLLDPVPGFQRSELRTDHRTQDVSLAKFFEETRDFILEGEGHPRDVYVGTRERIEEAAFCGVRGLSDPVIPAGGRTMVLLRSRRALLSECHRLMNQDRAFRLRPSGHGKLIRPWIGALLAGLPLDTPISRDVLADRFPSVAPLLRFRTGDDLAVKLDEPLSPEIMDEAWQTLRDLADNPGHRLNLAHLHRRLAWGSLPSDLLRDFLGNAGPLLSTIHGAKGLEADHVVLMLPRLPEASLDEETHEFERPFDFEEEARVLYVGATRARRRLYIGSQKSGKLRRLDGKRSWRGHPTDFSMEIGIEGDVLPFCEGGPDQRGLVQAARALAAPGESPKARPGVAMRDAHSGAYRIFRADLMGVASGPALGLLSSSVLAALATGARAPVSALPARIGGFYLSGAATFAWGSEDDELRGIALSPVLCGLATISMEIHE